MRVYFIDNIKNKQPTLGITLNGKISQTLTLKTIIIDYFNIHATCILLKTKQ